MLFSFSWNDLYPIVPSDSNNNRVPTICKSHFFHSLNLCHTMAWAPLTELFSKNLSKWLLPSLSTRLQHPCWGLPQKGPCLDNSQHQWYSPPCTHTSWEIQVSALIPAPTEQTWNILCYPFQGTHLEIKETTDRYMSKRRSYTGHPSSGLLFRQNSFPFVSSAHQAAHFREIIRHPQPSSCVSQESQRAQ